MRNLALDALPEAFELPCSRCRVMTRRDLLEDCSSLSPTLRDCCPGCTEWAHDTVEAEEEHERRMGEFDGHRGLVFGEI